MERADRSYGWLLGRVHGIPVYLGRAWPIIALVVVVTFGPTVELGSRSLGYAVAAGYAVLLLLSVLAHEAGHAVVARRVGARVDRVVADLWGGHTVFDSGELRPGSAALVAVAGPTANLAVAALAWGLAQGVRSAVPYLLLWALFVTNLFVAGFNLLPGLPLDGGFVVDAVVWKVTGNRATGMVFAGWLGRILTVLVALWFVAEPMLRGRSPSLVTMVWVGLIGAFLWTGATQAIRAGAARHSIQSVRVGQLLKPVAVVAGHGSGQSVVLALHDAPTAERAVLVDPHGEPLGFVDTTALASVPMERLDQVPAMSFLLRPPVGWVVRAEPGDDTFSLVRAFSGFGPGAAIGSAVLVVDRAGRPVGTVAVGDLNDALLGA
ncbi:MAG: site-2 protease family protein [Dermatophilaceae bacterium]